MTDPDGYYAAFLRVAERRCVVIGGGDVAWRKAQALLGHGADVTVIAPEVVAALATAASADRLELIDRVYEDGDLAGAFLAVSATGCPATDAAVAAEARRERCLLNVADAPELSDFIAPSVLHRGPLQIAVSTGGAAPAIARRLREGLEDAIGPEWERYVELAGRVRALAAERVADPAERRRIAEALAASDLLDRLRGGELPTAESVLEALQSPQTPGPESAAHKGQ